MWFIFLILFLYLAFGALVSVVYHGALGVGLMLANHELDSDEFYFAATREQCEAAVAEYRSALLEWEASRWLDWRIILYRWPFMFLRAVWEIFGLFRKSDTPPASYGI